MVANVYILRLEASGGRDLADDSHAMAEELLSILLSKFIERLWRQQEARADQILAQFDLFFDILC